VTAPWTPGPLNILCAGAAQGLVGAVQGVFLELTGCRVEGRFGPAGAMRETLRSGAPCDVMIDTADTVSELQAGGRLAPGPAPALGSVRTGMAVRGQTPLPDISTADALRASLLNAKAIYVSDTRRSIAGLHFVSVLSRLGIEDRVASRLRPYPNGVAAMRALADDPRPGAIGCSQISEIRFTPDVVVAGSLPETLGLAMVYCAAVSASTRQPELARRFVDLIAGPRSRCLRVHGGFDCTNLVPSSAR